MGGGSGEALGPFHMTQALGHFHMSHCGVNPWAYSKRVQVPHGPYGVLEPPGLLDLEALWALRPP